MKRVFRVIAILPLLFGNSIAQGFAEQAQAAQQQPPPPPQDSLAQPPQDSAALQWQPPSQGAAPVAPAATPPEPPPQAAAPKLIAYEEFLSGIDGLAKGIVPEIQRFDSLKAAANAETPAPKDEFDKQADYEKRVADFEKTKQQKIAALEQEYQAKTKESADKIKLSIIGNEDFQPNWDGILKKDAGVEEYKERINKLSEKISEMKTKISGIRDLLGKIYLDKKDSEEIQKVFRQKNTLYISRLERAAELMRDYIMQEQAKILTSEKKKAEITLGNYNAEKEEFEFSVNDSISQTVPFDFSGFFKMSPALARETNRQTDNFTANVDYINYPFIINGEKLYPGAKKARIYYKDQEFLTKGKFKGIQRFNGMEGYLEWALYADSLLSGKLAPKNLDSSYAMGTSGVIIASGISSPSEGGSSGSSFWTTKNTVRVVAFGLSAVSLGLGIMQNSDADKKSKTMGEKYLEAYNAIGTSEETEKEAAFNKSVKELNDSENLRNGFYIAAGVFGVAGIATFFF